MAKRRIEELNTVVQSTPLPKFVVARPPTSILPLTTVFSQPEPCKSSWILYTNNTQSSNEQGQTAEATPSATWIHRGWRELNQQNLLSSCQPNSNVTIGYDALTFSPGVCFQGYATEYQAWRSETSDSVALCCPQGYRLVVPEGRPVEEAKSCTSWFSSPIVALAVPSDTLPPNITSFQGPSMTISSGVAETDALVVAWSPEDWETFPVSARPALQRAPMAAPTAVLPSNSSSDVVDLSGSNHGVLLSIILTPVLLFLVFLFIVASTIKKAWRSRNRKEDVSPKDDVSTFRFGNKQELDGTGKSTGQFIKCETYELPGDSPDRYEMEGNQQVQEIDGIQRAELEFVIAKRAK